MLLASRRVRRGRAGLERSYERVRSYPHAGEEYERILRLVYERVLQPGDCAFDIGAHVGKHALPMAMSVGASGRIVAVEPIGWAAERLERRAAVAGLDDVVVIRNACVGSTSGTVTFHIVGDRPGISSVRLRPGVTGTTATVVEQGTLDGLARQFGPPRFVKIDVEGAESDVLEGGVQLLSEHRPMLHLEVVPRAMGAFGRTVGDIHDVLAPRGYRLFDLLGHDVTRRDVWEWSALLPAPCDYIAVHANDPALRAVRNELRHSFLRRADVDVEERRPSPNRAKRADHSAPSTPSRRPQLVIVPTSAEAAIEAVAVSKAVASRGVRATIGLHPKDAAAEWRTALNDAPWTTLDKVSAQRFLVIAADDTVARPLARTVGRDAVYLRTCGIEPMRVGTPGAAKRYRGYAKLLLRSRLEVAELGDRECELLGIRASPDGPDHGRAGTLVIVPPSIVERPDVRAWARAAVGSASQFGEFTVVGFSAARARLADLQMQTLNIQALRSASRVVLPLCDEASLVETLGIEPVVFDPAVRRREWSRAWIETLPVARTRAELRALLGVDRHGEVSDHERWLSGLRETPRYPAHNGDYAERWIEALDLT